MMPATKERPAPVSPVKAIVSDGKITKTQKTKIHAFHEVSKHLGFRFSEDFESKNAHEIADALIAKIQSETNAPSETKVVMMQAFDVTLGGVTHTVGRLPMKAEASIRRKLQDLISSASDFVGEQGINLEKITDQDAVKTFVPFLINDAWETLLDIFWDYAAPSGIDREKHEAAEGAEAVMFDEMMDALTSLLEVVIPFFAHQVRRTMGAAKRINLGSRER